MAASSGEFTGSTRCEHIYSCYTSGRASVPEDVVLATASVKMSTCMAPGSPETRRIGFARRQWPRADDASGSGRSSGAVPLRGVWLPSDGGLFLDGGAGALVTSGNLGLRLVPPPALELGRRQAVGRTMETLVIPPVDPFAGLQLDMLGRPPGSATADQLRLVESMDRLRDGSDFQQRRQDRWRVRIEEDGRPLWMKLELGYSK